MPDVQRHYFMSRAFRLAAILRHRHDVLLGH
ncbi:hypothetical protein SRS16P2_00342 (plasmid) [Variovorax sp. SRS16]|nr:hypothetical protein SRS16P2_00342 [Variovorax sp. SRS16]